jgi:hypothetical protein
MGDPLGKTARTYNYSNDQRNDFFHPCFFLFGLKITFTVPL